MPDNAPQLPSPRELHELRKAARQIERIIPCRHSAEEMWPYVTQVDLINRAAGSSAVEYQVFPGAGGASVIRGTARKVGALMRYTEMPYEWSAPQYVHGELLYDSGPLRYLRIRAEMLAEKRAVRYLVDYVPRGMFSPAGLFGRMIAGQLVKIVRRIDQRLPDAVSDPLGAAGFADDSAAALRRRDELAAAWRFLAPDSVVPSLLAGLVATAPDPVVARMRPYAVARQLGTTREETLLFCLRAVESGFLDLSWDLVCPSCGGAKKRARTLSDLDSADAHCDVCNIRYDAEFTRNVEVSFRPAAKVRAIDDREFCLQSPSHQRLILAQANLEPHSSVRLPLSLVPGHYRLRCIGMPGEALFDAAFGRRGEEAHVRIGDGLESSSIVCPPCLDVTIENTTPSWRTIRFEHHGYREDAATAAEVTTLQEFRDRFSAEVLRPGIQVGVSNIALLFSDLQDSTKLYEAVGDAAAFSLVQTHFELMKRVIAGHRGAIVKTMGDGVMAAFTSVETATAAAIEVLDAFAAWNEERAAEQRLVVKLGVHAGPCLALNLNDKLDYFGSTVNRAARIREVSGGGELTLAAHDADAPAIRELLRARPYLATEERRALLKGIDGEHRVVVIRDARLAISRPAPPVPSDSPLPLSDRMLSSREGPRLPIAD